MYTIVKAYNTNPSRVATGFNNKVIATVPYDTIVDTSVMKKVPVVHFKPNSKTSHGFKNIAASLIGVDYKAERSLWDRIVGWFVEE